MALAFPRGCVALLPLIAVLALHPAGAQEPGLAVRITSPLGRTGLPGPIRIVAQLSPAPSTKHGVWFYVDQQLLKSVEGPPYAVEWVDENPFERREITVIARDGLGRESRDKVVLQPFEITEVTDVASVLLEAAVQDKAGRFVRNLPAPAFTVLEDGVPQKLDVVQQEAVGATFAMLVDSSASMSRRMDFVQRTAATLAGSLGALTGPTKDPSTIVQAIDAIRPTGGTAILDALVAVSKSLQSAEGRRAIVLITDGYDEHSTATFDEALAAVKAAHATV